MAVKFVSFTTFVDPLFWDELGMRKLNDWKLDEQPHPITATYCNRNVYYKIHSFGLDFYFKRNHRKQSHCPLALVIEISS